MADAAYGTVITDTLDHYHNPGHGWLWNGTATNRPTPDVYQTNHVYRFDFTGRGAAELLTFTDPVYGDNVGMLTFELYEIVQAQSLPLPQANFELIQAIQDQANRVWVLGAFSNSVTVGTNTFTSRGQRDVLLIQYSPAGVVNWAATIGAIYDDSAVRMSVQSNVCVVAGFENSSLTVVDGVKATNTTAYSGGGDGFLLNFSSAGSLIWKASVTGTSAGMAANSRR